MIGVEMWKTALRPAGKLLDGKKSGTVENCPYRVETRVENCAPCGQGGGIVENVPSFPQACG